MENASKALIIAGSVLIAIVLITIGIIILNSSEGVTEQVDSSMSALQIQMFNEQFTKYKGSQSSQQIKKLIGLIIINNTENEDKKIKVNFKNGTTTVMTNITEANTIQTNFNTITTWFSKYMVTCTSNSKGLIDQISITSIS